MSQLNVMGFARGLVCVLMAVVSMQFAHGQEDVSGLKDLTTDELADLVEAGEAKFSRMSGWYMITYGNTLSWNALIYTFKPQTPPYGVMGAYSCDKALNFEYVMEDVLTKDQKQMISESAFDGKVGTYTAMNEPGGDRWSGVIMKRKPKQLDAAGVTHWQPRKVAFGMLGDMPRSELIRNAERVEIEHTKFLGQDAYQVNMRIKQDKNIIYQGKRGRSRKYLDVCTWYVPDYGMLSVCEVIYDVDPRTKERKKDISMGYMCRRVKEVADGVWFPTSLAEYRHRKKNPVAWEVTIRSIDVGDDAIVRGQVDFRPGTHVTDEIKHKKYRVKSGSDSRDNGNRRSGTRR